MHAAHNLVEAHQAAGRNAVAAVNLARAKKMVSDLEMAFWQQAREDALISFRNLKSIREQTDTFNHPNHSSWWEDILMQMDGSAVAELLIRLAANAVRSSVLNERLIGCETAEGIRQVVLGLREDLLRERAKVMKAVDDLSERTRRDPTMAEVQAQRNCGRCHRFHDDLVRPTCGLCLFETQQILPYERVVFFFDESCCPSCDQVVVINQGPMVLDGDDLEEKYTESELKALKPKELKACFFFFFFFFFFSSAHLFFCLKALAESKGVRGIKKKADLIARLLELVGPDIVKQTNSFCGGCRRWWHLRCLPKDVQKMLQAPNVENWRCPVCLNAVVLEGHAAGRVRHQGLYHQLLLSIKRFASKVGEEDEDADSDGEEEDLQSVSSVKTFFGLIEKEMEGLSKIFTSLHNMVGAHDALAKLKQQRVRIAESPEEAQLVKKQQRKKNEEAKEDEDMVLVVPEDELFDQIELLEDKLVDLEIERKRILSSFRFLKNEDQGSECKLVFFLFVFFCFLLFSFLLFCFVLFCFVSFCFLLFCFVLFCLFCLFVRLFVVLLFFVVLSSLTLS